MRRKVWRGKVLIKTSRWGPSDYSIWARWASAHMICAQWALGLEYAVSKPGPWTPWQEKCVLLRTKPLVAVTFSHLGVRWGCIVEVIILMFEGFLNPHMIIAPRLLPIPRSPWFRMLRNSTLPGPSIWKLDDTNPSIDDSREQIQFDDDPMKTAQVTSSRRVDMTKVVACRSKEMLQMKREAEKSNGMERNARKLEAAEVDRDRWLYSDRILRMKVFKERKFFEERCCTWQRFIPREQRFWSRTGLLI